MIKRGQSKGFTIVELLIVVIIVAILATLISLAYGNAQAQANDMKIRDAADKFADAIRLMESRTGKFPEGGTGSTVVANSTTGCTNTLPNGKNGWQAPALDAPVKCTVGDALVAMGYLPMRLFTDLPYNTWYLPSTGYKNVFRIEQCGSKNYLLFTLEKPTTDDKTKYDQIGTGCATVANAKSNNNMQALIDLSAY